MMDLLLKILIKKNPFVLNHAQMWQKSQKKWATKLFLIFGT